MFLRVFVVVAVGVLAARTSTAAACSSTCSDGVQASGAKYRICMPTPSPACWNGQLVLFAHGYVDASKPVAIPENQLTLPGDNTSLPQLVNSLGYAFALSSYRVNGLAVPEGVEDTRDLVNVFTQKLGKPSRVYLTGASEGGLVTALSIEKYPNVYNAGLAACGPIGSFPAQINYIGDFRVVFDYYFPGVVPGSPLAIPPDVVSNWTAVYEPAVGAAVDANPAAARQLLKVTGAPGSTPEEVNNTARDLIGYNVFATNDAVQKLGGNPYDNRFRWFFGSTNDIDLNFRVQRSTPEPAAIASMQASYTTTGKLRRPLVTLHTTGDDIVPYWHENLYWWKAAANGSLSRLATLPVFRYGHCNFQVADVLLGFGLMVVMDLGQPMNSSVVSLVPVPQQQQFLRNAVERDVIRP